MTGQQTILQCGQLAGIRLFFKDINGGRKVRTSSQRGSQGGFINDSAAGGVYEDPVGFHDFEFAAADHAPRLTREGNVQRDNVGFTEDGFLVGPSATGLLGELVIGDQVIGKNADWTESLQMSN